MPEEAAKLKERLDTYRQTLGTLGMRDYQVCKNSFFLFQAAPYAVSSACCFLSLFDNIIGVQQQYEGSISCRKGAFCV